MIEQGIKLGVSTAILVSSGYSLTVIAIMSLSLLDSSGLLFVVGEFVPFAISIAFIIGILPAMGIGLVGGVLLGLIYKRIQHPVPTRLAFIMGCGVGTLLMAIIHALLWPTFTKYTDPQLTLAETIRDYLFGSALLLFLTFPSVITIPTFGWMSLKLNRQILPMEQGATSDVPTA